jgi:enamine deaminase RidA (YjgF/YER057c/UK114 family)
LDRGVRTAPEMTRAERRRISSGGPFEARYGYSRALVAGNACWVSGTTDAGADGRSLHPNDPAGQARAVLEIIEAALHEAGFSRHDVVRVRIFTTDIGRSRAILEVLGERFSAVGPAATIVEVRALIEPSLLVEIEADAVRDP